MSASSWWVTCGIVCHAALRFRALICWMRESGSRVPSPAAGSLAAGLAAVGCASVEPVPAPSRSSLVTRPFRPEPVTLERSIPLFAGEPPHHRARVNVERRLTLAERG